MLTTKSLENFEKEDIHISLKRLEKPTKRWSLEEVEQNVDLLEK